MNTDNDGQQQQDDERRRAEEEAALKKSCAIANYGEAMRVLDRERYYTSTEWDCDTTGRPLNRRAEVQTKREDRK